MKIRAAIVTGLVLATAVTGVSQAAAPKKVCKLVSDSATDGARGDALEIISADVATNTKSLTAVIRVKKLAKSNPDAPTGQSWYIDWTVPGGKFPMAMSYAVSPTGESASVSYKDGNLYRGATGDVTKAVFDTVKNEIRMTAPLNAWAAEVGVTIKPKMKLSGLAVNAFWYVGAIVTTPAGTTSGGSLQPGDDAAGKPYVAGTPSCVTVGK